MVVALGGCWALDCAAGSCTCTQGRVDCSRKGLYFIPRNMEEDSHTVLLAFNQIGTISAVSLLRYRNLQHLDLQSNLISTIHNQAFQYQQNLTYLDLSGNLLATIHSEQFRPLFRLLTLNLGSNWISELPDGALDSLAALDALYLHNNALTDLAGKHLSKLPALRHLRLDGNPWVCTCRIQTLLDWMKHNPEKVEETDRTLCRFPGYLDQFPLLGIAGSLLFIGSVLLCFVIGSLVVAQRQLRHWRRMRPRVYRKRIVNKRDAIIYGHQLPVCST
ncbi:hypothetical protein XELAEV_18041410mg [Xenopus laevis]|uniref:LRRCT domain-containing protein n=1 Tax=Xenopus laevis TaxID=8355 RepID=A0A974C2E5_XENLA|nr:hypothetical protein XELAEV_18041410mg [Xenopus laevis]